MPIAATSSGILPAACAASVWNTHAVLLRDGADGRQRLQHADLVVGRHDGDEDGARGHRRAELGEVDEALRVHAEPRDAAPLALEPFAGVQHRLVLGGGGDDVVAAIAQRVGDAFERQVVGLGRAAGEDDLPGRCADEVGDLGPRRVHRLLRVPAVGVLAARGIAEVLGEKRQHRLEHARVNRRRRVIVQVDGSSHARPAPMAGSPFRVFARQPGPPGRSESRVLPAAAVRRTLPAASRSPARPGCGP